MHGYHNLSNAVMAMYTAFLHGIHPKDSFSALTKSKGVKRRFETIFQNDNKLVVDDFAHHPTAILHTVQAAVSRFSSKRIMASSSWLQILCHRDIMDKNFMTPLLLWKKLTG